MKKTLKELGLAALVAAVIGTACAASTKTASTVVGAMLALIA